MEKRKNDPLISVLRLSDNELEPRVKEMIKRGFVEEWRYVRHYETLTPSKRTIVRMRRDN